MSKWGKVDFKQLKKLQDKMQKLNDMQQEFCEAAAKELAARLLAKVIRRTPTGVVPDYITPQVKKDHWQGYTGGTLKRGWTGGKTSDGAAYAKSLPISKNGDTFVIDIINPVEYASYVEYGHRATPGRFVPELGMKLKSGWVQGRFMLTISVDELQKDAPKILEKKLAKWLGDTLNGK